MSSQNSRDPVAYMERTRLYYRALGYDRDYVWAHFDDIPFARLSKPLTDASIALVTTAMPTDLADPKAMGGRQIWSRETADPPSELATEHVAWDKESTHTRDLESFLPIASINELARDGVVTGLSARFHGAPTVYSQRQTIERDAPEIARRIQEDGADAVILCPL